MAYPGLSSPDRKLRAKEKVTRVKSRVFKQSASNSTPKNEKSKEHKQKGTNLKAKRPGLCNKLNFSIPVDAVPVL